MIFYLWLNGLSANFWAPNGVGPRQILTTFFFVHALWPDTINCVVPGGWSIGVEMLFYLFFPLLIALDARPRSFLALGFALYLLNLFVARPAYKAILGDFGNENLIDEFLYFQLFNQGPIFLVGMALYQIVKGEKLDAACWSIVIGWVAGAFVLKYGFQANGAPFFWLPVFIISALIYFVLRYRVSFTPINVFGELSYSIYLAHFALIDLVKAFFERYQIDPTTAAAFCEALMLIILSSFIIGYIMRVLVELPSSVAGQKIIKAVFVPALTV